MGAPEKPLMGRPWWGRPQHCQVSPQRGFSCPETEPRPPALESVCPSMHKNHSEKPMFSVHLLFSGFSSKHFAYAPQARFSRKQTWRLSELCEESGRGTPLWQERNQGSRPHAAVLMSQASARSSGAKTAP